MHCAFRWSSNKNILPECIFYQIKMNIKRDCRLKQLKLNNKDIIKEFCNLPRKPVQRNFKL